MGQTLLLSEQDVHDLLSMEDVVAAVEKTFQGMGDGTVVNPSKVNLDLGESAAYPPYNGFMNAMPAYVGFADVAGLKWAGGNLGERKKRNIPYCSSLIMLVNPHINNFISVLDGALITNMRTGAQTAVALKYLFNHGSSQRRPIRLGIYGAGMQGHMQTRAIATLFDIEELRIYDVSRPALERFQADMQDVVPGKIILCDDPSQAAQGDAVICVTQSKDEFLKEEWLSPDTIVFPMGSYQECEDAVLLHADKIVVDHVEQTMHRGALSKLVSQGKLNESSITCTIGQLAACKKETLETLMGKMGTQLYEYANGLDSAPVRARLDAEPVKSVGNGTTFPTNLTRWEQVRAGLSALADSVAGRLRRYGMYCGGVALTIRYADFRQFTRQTRLSGPTHLQKDIYRAALTLAQQAWHAPEPIRALTVTALYLTPDGESYQQLDLLAGDTTRRDEKQERLEQAMDAIRGKYGKGSITFGNTGKFSGWDD